MTRVLSIALLLTFSCNSTQKTTTTKKDVSVLKYAETITEQELSDHLYTYASDEFEGRNTGEEGEKKAIEYLKNEYEKLGIPAAQKNGDYFQKVDLEKTGVTGGSILIGNNSFNIGDGVITYSTPIEGLTEIVYVGYGIVEGNYSDYANIDVKGKFVLIKSGQPDESILPKSSKKWDNWRDTLIERMEIATNQGAKGVLYYDSAYYNRVKSRYDHDKSLNRGSISIKTANTLVKLYISEEVATFIYPEIESEDTPKLLNNKIELNYTKKLEEIDSKNVAAIIEGTEKPDEYVFISAHLDHIGISPNGEINNGADDDGSGTVAMLEIAEAFKKAKDEGKGPKRSIVFLHVTGEEKGLLGSEFYSDNPIFPLENTVCDLNIDMIGRIDPKRDGDRNYIYLIGSDKLSTDLHNISEEVNNKYCHIQLDYKYNDENDPNRFYYRSDHYNFAKHNIPIIFYFNGTHDDYHKPTDTPDKINYDLLTNRTKLIFHTAWEVANRDQRVVVDKTK